MAITSYSGKSSKDSIEITGRAFGKEFYNARTFSLAADIIDALEGSKYFKDVKGFDFSREKDRDGNISSPIDIQLSLQDLAIPDQRDTPINSPTANKTETTAPKLS